MIYLNKHVSFQQQTWLSGHSHGQQHKQQALGSERAEFRTHAAQWSSNKGQEKDEMIRTPSQGLCLDNGLFFCVFLLCIF
jgi:hypothetical protein